MLDNACVICTAAATVARLSVSGYSFALLPQGRTLQAAHACRAAGLTGLPLSRCTSLRRTPGSSFKDVQNMLFKFFTARTYFTNHPSSNPFALLLHACCTLPGLQCRHTQLKFDGKQGKTKTESACLPITCFACCRSLSQAGTINQPTA
jgi:hypothetical protein